MSSVMGGGGVGLLDWEIAIVATAVQSLRVSPTTGEIFLKLKGWKLSKLITIYKEKKIVEYIL